MTTLIVAAHPDDEVLGCGGTMARLNSEGERVHVAILGEGITSRFEDPGAADQAQVDALAQTTHRVAAHLGAEDVSMFGLPDNRFDVVALLDIVKKVEEVIERIRPDVIFCQHGGDLNVDHQLTYRAVLTATRPLPGQSVREVYAFEVNSSTEWAFQRFSPAFQPNTFIDIADTLDAKIEAMAMDEGEVRPFPHPRSPEALRAQARKWGSVAGVQAAEAFEAVRIIR